MDFKQLIGRWRGAFLNAALKWGVGYILKQLEDPTKRGKMKALGAMLGRRMGQMIPSEEADGFVAAFVAGVTDGLNEQDGDRKGGGADPLAPSSGSK